MNVTNRAIRPILEANRLRYRKERMKNDRELIDNDSTSIFEQNDDDKAFFEQDVVNWVIINNNIGHTLR